MFLINELGGSVIFTGPKGGCICAVGVRAGRCGRAGGGGEVQEFKDVIQLHE